MTKQVDEYGLSLKEREFADLYRGGDDEVRGNAKRCYMRLHPKSGEGSAEVNAHKWLRKDKIEEYLKLKVKETSEECGITAQWVLDQAVAVHERCMQTSPVLDKKGDRIYVEGPDGDLVPAYTFDASGANKALDLVGKHVDIQAWKEQRDITSGGKTIKNEWHIHPVTTDKNAE